MTEPEAAFRAAMARRMPHVEMRDEADADLKFLHVLHISCSPFAGVLPEPILLQQAEFANRGFKAGFPHAMRLIAMLDCNPVGRFMVDWNGPSAHGVDIAVLKHARTSGLGLRMLQSWVVVADQLNLPCTLQVLAENPARKIYQHLGFIETGNAEDFQPMIAMERKARPALSG